MIDIAVQEINKYYGSNHVIKGISFEILKGEKVGLLGKNGSGKTTLFKIISGIEAYESGSLIKASGKRIEVLEQINIIDAKNTVEDVLYSAFDGLFKIYGNMKQLEELIKVSPLDESLIRYGQLQTEYEAFGGYDIESKIDKICSGMKIVNAMRSQLFANLSEGEKTRVNLARILLKDSDILLLDEPTNHLDMDSIQWVEEFIENFRGTVIIISHDRKFLDKVINRIIEIEGGKLNFYEGNYSFYVKEKEKRFFDQKEKYEQQQRKVEQLEQAAKRMHEWAKNANNPDMHRRAFSIEKRINRIDVISRPTIDKKITAEFKESSFSSNEMLTFKGISKSYENKLLFSNVNLTIARNDCIAIIGENGCGKSTLIKLIRGTEVPEKGEVLHSNSLKIAYMPQIIEFEDLKATVLDTLRYELQINEEKARRILAAFHFKGKDVLQKTAMLSGGEKSRLKMCILMQGESNFLLLDEPTNHLDIASREWIEEAIGQFNGTILFVSHDRYFINKFATRVWEIKDGKVSDFDGNFDEYCRWKNESFNRQQKQTMIKLCKAKKNYGKSQQNEEATKLEKNLSIENQIEEIEGRIKYISDEMEAAASNFGELKLLYDEKVELENNLKTLYSNWVELCSE